MIKIKTEQEILDEIISDIKINYSNGIATYTNSPASDIFLETLKGQVYDTYVLSDFISRSRNLTELEAIVRAPSYANQLAYALSISYTDAKAMISNAIDYLIADWNEERKPPQKSSGMIRIYFSDASAITLEAGLIFTTFDGTKFKTTNSFTNFPVAYDEMEGLYFVDSAIQAVDTGSKGNVLAGTIVVNTDTRIVKVVNLAETKFGSDLETDLELIARVRNSWLTRDVSSISGLTQLIKKYPGVYDCSIVLPFSTLQKRNEKNAVDIYLIAEPLYKLKYDIFNVISASYAYNIIDNELDYATIPIDYDTVNNTCYKLASQPAQIIEMVQLSPTLNGTYTEISEDLWSFVKDSTGAFAESVRGHDFISVDKSAIPELGGWLKVSYIYDSLYQALQNMIRNFDKTIIGADVLFKKAVEQKVDIVVTSLTILDAFSSLESIKAIINNDLKIFFNGGIDSNGIQRSHYKISQRLDKSDLIDLILNVNLVDYIDVDKTYVYVDGQPIGTTFTPDDRSYLSFNSVIFNTNTNIDPSDLSILNQSTINYED